MDSKNSAKLGKNFYCEKCNYKCYYKSDLDKHFLTAKHKMVVNGSKKLGKYICDCGRSYKYDSGYYRHKRQCHYIKQKMTQIHHNETEPIMNIQYLLKEHQEKQEQRDVENQKKIEELTNQISNMSLVTNNTMNNKFNLNFFLNTQCKDAIDFQTFLQDHLQISQEDLFYFGNNGYVNGMMNIIDKSLGSIEPHKRPLHCTDIKRKIMYYKQRDGSWEKDEEKIHLKKLVKEIDNKTMDCLQNWEDGNRYKFEDMESQNFKWYFRVASETLGGDSSKDDQYMAKIMNHIVIETHVKKSYLLEK